ncbi:MAG: 50S ribosomal protein L11 methyltransferase [Deltaproteobacteria bacterium]|nr:50S ribosomal protein L11 methyltransferase [Deltaproteobacteria bacterium]
MAGKEQWLESRWQLEKSELDRLVASLEQMGSLGSYEDLPIDDSDPRFHSDQTELLAYFPDADAEVLRKKLSQLENNACRLEVIKPIPQGDWATAWRQHFKPMPLTRHVVIKPSWEDYQQQDGEVIVTLDPGMAFGTGQHDTTRFCAEFIEDIRENHPDLESLLDVGCGSGILSIIAKKLGFKNVAGVDNDVESVATAKENLQRNPDASDISFFVNDGGLDHPDLKKSDVVVSNIIAESLVELKDGLIALVKPNGYLVLSGIIPDRGEMVKQAFSGLEFLAERTSQDWHAYLYHKK